MADEEKPAEEEQLAAEEPALGEAASQMYDEMFTDGEGETQQQEETTASGDDNLTESSTNEGEGAENTEPQNQAAQENLSALDTVNPLHLQAMRLEGYSDVDIAAMHHETPETVEIMMRTAYAKQSASAQSMLMQQAQPVAPQQPQTPVVPQVPSDQDAIEASLRRAYGDKYDNLVDSVANGDGDVFKELMAPVANMLGEQQQAQAAVEQTRVAEDCNVWATSQSDLVKDHFGIKQDGTLDASDPNKMALQGQLADVAERLRIGYAQQGVAMSVKDALSTASLVLTKDLAASQARENLKLSATKRSARKTFRPSGSANNGPKPKTLEAAKQNALDYMAETGITQ